MSRTTTHHYATLLTGLGQPVKVGDKVAQPGDRRAGIVGGWNPVDGMVLIWTVPATAGDVRHLTPWTPETLGLHWGAK